MGLTIAAKYVWSVIVSRFFTLVFHLVYTFALVVNLILMICKGYFYYPFLCY